MKPRKIIHLDLDAFFCAVEELRDPSLRGKAFAVGGKPDERGVVSSCSYAARKCGVHSAMPMGRALRLCKELIIISPRHAAYEQASKDVMVILQSYTPFFEQISIDEAFLDVSDLLQEGEEIARQIQARVYEETHLPSSIGVASNKLVAKIANDVGKAGHRENEPPRAITVVKPGDEARFLAPLAVQMLWGVGPKTAEKLRSMGIYTIGQLASRPESNLVKEFGKIGYDMARRARGLDNREVETVREVKSVSQEITFDRDTRDERVLCQTLQRLSEEVAYRLRSQGFAAQTIRLKLRWPDFTTLSRQITLSQPINQDQILSGVAIRLFEQVWSPGKAVRLLGVGASNLQQGVYQMSLWETAGEKERRLLAVMDQLQERFGKPVIRRGSLPGRKH